MTDVYDYLPATSAPPREALIFGTVEPGPTLRVGDAALDAMPDSTVLYEVGDKVAISVRGGTMLITGVVGASDVARVESVAVGALDLAQEALLAAGEAVGDVRQPKAPTGLTAVAVAFINTAGRPRSRLQASWSAVTEATDDSAIPISRYEVWAKQSGGAYVLLAETVDPSLSWESFEPGSSWTFRVRAIGLLSPNPGAWSSEANLLMQVDETPPDAPGAGVLASELGSLMHRWNGLTASGEPQPADYSHTELEVSADIGDTWQVAHRYGGPGSVLLSAEYDLEHRVRLRSFDLVGNASDYSTVVSATPHRVSGLDLADAAVSVGKLATGSVTRDKIATGAVGPSEIADFALTAKKFNDNRHRLF